MEKSTLHDGKKRRHRVDVLVFNNEDSILCYDHGPGKLPELPGGAIDQNETPVVAAIREVMEESGWTVNSPIKVPDNREYVFEGTDDCWFTELGWKQESNVCVMCKAEKLEPNGTFGKEGDQRQFVFTPISKVLAMTELALKCGISPRFQNIAKSRIEAIRTLMIMASGERPTWSKW